MNPIICNNYYEKYMKYKKKYIDYKKKLYTNKNIIGGGINGKITLYRIQNGQEGDFPSFIQDQNVVNLDEYSNLDDLYEMMSKFTFYIKLETICDGKVCVIYYRIGSIVGSGATSFAFRIEQIIPHLLSDVNNNFIIKFNREKGKEKNSNEGQQLDNFNVLPRIKALYQGTGIIDFAIFNFLGDDLENFLKAHTSISPTDQLSLIRQLHEQLYAMNSNKPKQFHNDVKLANIVVIQSNPPNPTFQLSLIDYGLATVNMSQFGTAYTTCMIGCLRFCLQKYEKSKSLPFNKDSLIKLTQRLYRIRDSLDSYSTDYVGFFNVVICLIGDTDVLNDIYI